MGNIKTQIHKIFIFISKIFTRCYPKNIRKILIKRGKIVKTYMLVLVGAYMSNTITAKAEGDTSVITKPLDNLKTLLFAIIGAVGLIILAKNIMEFAQALQAGDTSTMNSALKGIVAGILMASIGSVITFLGISGS